jgi:hypothetical protein
MHALILILFILGLIGVIIFELWLVMRALAVLTSRLPRAQRDFAKRDPSRSEWREPG